MPGFFISTFKGCDTKLNNVTEENCIKNELLNKNYIVKRNTLNKFLNDKLFSENDDFIIITEGVILNKEALIKKYGQNNFFDTVLEMRKNSNLFFDEFIGSFSGAVFNKKCEEWVVFTDKTGTKPVFYYNDENNFIAGSQVNFLLDTLKTSGKALSFDSEAAYSMLTYGFMYDNMTYCREIKKLLPGEYLTFGKNGFEKHPYWKLTNSKYNLKEKSEDEIIEILDEKFKEAVKREFQKDDEYNYRHFADLSGGFDARMVNFAANKLGIKNILNLHYSQSDSDEELISKEIAAYLKNTLLIRPLDDASFLFDFKKLVSMNYGLALYSGITGGESLLSSLNCRDFGIEHTGMIGDVVIGSFLNDSSEINKREPSGMYSKKLASKVKGEYVNKYPNFEIQKMYVRAFGGACNTFIIRQNYTESYAPFLDPDFLEFCMSIPVNMRAKHKLYNKWVLKKYPDAADFVWTTTGSKITHSDFYILLHNRVSRMLSKTKSLFSKKARKCEMNPFEYWYKNNPEIKKCFDEYFTKNINNNVFSEILKKDLRYLYTSGTVLEKTQVITVLASAEYYF